MAQSTSAGYTQSQEDARSFSYQVAASTQIWAQHPVAIQLSTGFLVPMSDTSGLVFVGIALQSVNNTGDAIGGALSCDVQPLDGPFGVNFLNLSGTALQTWIGKQLFFIDDQTVGLYTATSHTIVAGRCVQVWTIGTAGWVCVDVQDRETLAVV